MTTTTTLLLFSFFVLSNLSCSPRAYRYHQLFDQVALCPLEISPADPTRPFPGVFPSRATMGRKSKFHDKIPLTFIMHKIQSISSTKPFNLCSLRYSEFDLPLIERCGAKAIFVTTLIHTVTHIPVAVAFFSYILLQSC